MSLKENIIPLPICTLYLDGDTITISRYYSSIFAPVVQVHCNLLVHIHNFQIN